MCTSENSRESEYCNAGTTRLSYELYSFLINGTSTTALDTKVSGFDIN